MRRRGLLESVGERRTCSMIQFLGVTIEMSFSDLADERDIDDSV